MAGMHMGGMPNQGMMNLTPMQQQQLMQQQNLQQQQQQPTQQQQMQMQMHMQQQQVPQQQMGPVGNIQQQSQPQPQQQQQAQQQGLPNPATDQQKLDHIAKVKSLLYPLKESLANCFRTGAQNFYQNGMIDFGTLKGADISAPRFDKQLEEFYSICDQIELNLQAAISCSSQLSSSQRHVPTPVSVTRQDPPPPVMGGQSQPDFLTYATYIDVAKNQVAYVKDVIDALNDAATNLSSSE